jgi:GGDEF domain-containing protein
MKGLVSEKVERINALLREHGKALPPITLSVGVAFADRENPQGDIFHDADIALNRAKKERQSRCEMY